MADVAHYSEWFCCAAVQLGLLIALALAHAGRVNKKGGRR